MDNMFLYRLGQKRGGGSGGGGGDATDGFLAFITGETTVLSSKAVTAVADHMFRYTRVTEVDFPNATRIGQYAFEHCTGLTTVDFPAVTTIGDRAFGYCDDLITMNFPMATSVSNYMGIDCNNLATVNIPLATSVGNNAFQRSPKLTAVNFPLATTIGYQAFRECSALETADFPSATSLDSNVFNSCTKLTAVILRGNVVCSLRGTDSFTSTAVESGTGYIYVPSALIDEYKSATNWSTYAAQFRALEDYTVDGTTTGALDQAKI